MTTKIQMLTFRTRTLTSNKSWWVGTCTLLVGLFPEPSAAQTLQGRQESAEATTPASIGIKFGGTSSTIAREGINAEPLSGFQLGMFYESYGEYFGWRLEGLYVQQGAFSPSDGREMVLNYVKLPLLAKVRLSNDASRTLVPYFFGGPAFGFDTNGKRGVPKGDVSVMFGGGVTVNVGKFSIIADASYTRGITSNVPPFLREPSQFETRVPKFFDGANFTNRLLSFSVGLAFPLSRNVVGFRTPARNVGRPPTRDIISRVEIDATDVNTAYEIVQRLHPQWLRARGQITLREAGEEEVETSGAVGPVVYVNNARRGDIAELRTISVETISEIFYFNGRDASFRFGTGHPSGVLQVMTR